MFFLFVALKVPVLAACWLVWWAVRAEPAVDEEETPPGEDDGGNRGSRHPVPRLPRSPRRGPHGDPAPAPPPRVRPVKARARDSQRS